MKRMKRDKVEKDTQQSIEEAISEGYGKPEYLNPHEEAKFTHFISILKKHRPKDALFYDVVFAVFKEKGYEM